MSWVDAWVLGCYVIERRSEERNARNEIVVQRIRTIRITMRERNRKSLTVFTYSDSSHHTSTTACLLQEWARESQDERGDDQCHITIAAIKTRIILVSIQECDVGNDDDNFDKNKKQKCEPQSWCVAKAKKKRHIFQFLTVRNDEVGGQQTQAYSHRKANDHYKEMAAISKSLL